MEIDRNLLFLEEASNEDLRILCDIVTKEKDGSYRITETLSGTQSYLLYYPDNINKMLPELLHEFRLFGGNSVLNFFRGEGPEYSEILRDVACRCRVVFNDYSTTSDEYVERQLLEKLVKDVLYEATNDELRQVMGEMKLSLSSFNQQKAISDLENLFKSENSIGFMLITSIVSIILSQFTGCITNKVPVGALSRLMAIMLAPTNLIIESLCFVVGKAGPAYKVMIPAVIQISYIRQKIKHNLKK